MTTLRDYQEKCWRDIRAAKSRRVLLTLPTATGKTEVGSAGVLEYYRSGKRCLWLAHRRELVNQAVERLVAADIKRVDIGIIMSKDPRDNRHAPVQVASIDTLRRRDMPPAHLVVLDEAHHAAAPTFAELLSFYPEARILGLTATPFRNGGLQLGDHFEELICGPQPSWLIAAGWMAAPRVFAPPDSELPSLSEVSRKRGDFQLEQLGRAVNRRELVGSIVTHWKRHADNRRTIAFAVNIAHAHSIAAEFLDAGVPAEVLVGTTHRLERAQMYARLEAGQTRVLVTVGVLTEGWDAPYVKCAIIARPTCSLLLHIQMSGRILRPWHGVDPIILDHAGNTMYFDVPHADLEMSLTMSAPVRGKGPGQAVDRDPVTGELTTRDGTLREVRSICVQKNCASCKALLSMHPVAMRRRRGRTDVLCRACASRKAILAKPAEERKESIRRGHATRARQQSPGAAEAVGPLSRERQELLKAGWKIGTIDGVEHWQPPSKQDAQWILFRSARKLFLKQAKQRRSVARSAR